MERSSLPVGILRDIAFERSQDTLVDGDILLLASDGVVSAGVGWVEEALRDFDLEQGRRSGAGGIHRLYGPAEAEGPAGG